MTAPEQDNAFSLDPAAHVQALSEQRNDAMDQASQWKAAAIVERQNHGHTLKALQEAHKRIQELEGAPAPGEPAEAALEANGALDGRKAPKATP